MKPLKTSYVSGSNFPSSKKKKKKKKKKKHSEETSYISRNRTF